MIKENLFFPRKLDFLQKTWVILRNSSHNFVGEPNISLEGNLESVVLVLESLLHAYPAFYLNLKSYYRFRPSKLPINFMIISRSKILLGIFVESITITILLDERCVRRWNRAYNLPSGMIQGSTRYPGRPPRTYIHFAFQSPWLTGIIANTHFLPAEQGFSAKYLIIRCS